MKHKKAFLGISGLLAVVLALALCLSMVSSAFAASDTPDIGTDGYDMTYPDSDVLIQKTINDAIWESLPSTEPTGSGVWHAFFRVQDSPNEQGYNTDYRPVQYDELTSATFTHNALFSSVPLIEYPETSGNWYYEFQLDINEASSTGLISLDKFEVYLTNDALLYNYPFEDGIGGDNSGLAKLVYELDKIGDSGDVWIGMDYLWNTGSGKRDYRVLIPQSNFAPYVPYPYDPDEGPAPVGNEMIYITIYTEHGNEGGVWESDDGYEEWGVAVYEPVPDTEVTIATSAVNDVVIAGQSIDLTITEANTGPIDLFNVLVHVYDDAALTSVIATLDETNRTGASGAGLTPAQLADATLQVGETWTWEYDAGPPEVNTDLHDIVVTDATTFTADGYADNNILHPAKNRIEVDFDHGNVNERAEITIKTLSTAVDIKANGSDGPVIIVAGQDVDLVVTETNDGDLDLYDVQVLVTYTDKDGIPQTVTLNYLNKTSESGGNTDDGTAEDGNAILDTGETWTWSYTSIAALENIQVNDATTFTATGSGYSAPGASGGVLVTSPTDPQELDTVTVKTLSTIVTIESDVEETSPGGNVELTVTEENDGDVDLYDVEVKVYDDAALSNVIATLDASNRTGSNGAGLTPAELADDILQVGETWTWAFDDLGDADPLNDILPELHPMISADTTFTATGSGWSAPGDPDGVEVTYPTDLDEQDDVTVKVIEGFTRTWGFWKTHLYLVQWMYDHPSECDPYPFPINLGDWDGDGEDMVIDSVCSYMALMWANQTHNSDGTPRTKLDATRIHLAHQALAAIMNDAMPNGAMPFTLQQIRDALEGTDRSVMIALAGELAAYNSDPAGHLVALPPSFPATGKTTGNIADPQGARDVGEPCETYWDTQTYMNGKGKTTILCIVDTDNIKIAAGGNVFLTVTLANYSTKTMTGAHVDLSGTSSSFYRDLDGDSIYRVSDGVIPGWTPMDTGLAVLDPGEIWTWELQVTEGVDFDSDTTFTGDAEAFDGKKWNNDENHYLYTVDSIFVDVSPWST